MGWGTGKFGRGGLNKFVRKDRHWEPTHLSISLGDVIVSCGTRAMNRLNACCRVLLTRYPITQFSYVTRGDPNPSGNPSTLGRLAHWTLSPHTHTWLR